MEYKFFDSTTPPDWLDAEWWRGRDNCDHLAHGAGVHQARIEMTAQTVERVFRREKINWIIEVGAGDGAMISMLPLDVQRVTTGYEIVADSVKSARDRYDVDVRSGNVLTDELWWGEPDNLVVCTEVLEHQEDPHRFIEKLLGQRAKWVIASSPHVETRERHEWNHAWAWDHAGYRKLFDDNGFEVTEQFDVEWSQFVIARNRRKNNDREHGGDRPVGDRSRTT